MSGLIKAARARGMGKTPPGLERPEKRKMQDRRPTFMCTKFPICNLKRR